MGLCLTRRKGESIVINDTTVITVVSVHGDKVRIDLTAPSEVRIDREEIWKAKQQEAIK